MQPLVAFAQALADGTRWRLLQLVLNEPLCVCELADILEMPQSSVSSHLQVIRKSGLLASEKCEKWVYYRVRPEFQELLETISRHFAATSEAGTTLAKDARRARKRLAERARSCCPRPKELVTLPSSQPNAKTI